MIKPKVLNEELQNNEEKAGILSEKTTEAIKKGTQEISDKIVDATEDIDVYNSSEDQKSIEKLVLNNGGFHVHMSVDKEFSQKGYAGFQDIECAVEHPGYDFLSPTNSFVLNRNIMEDEGFNEMVDIRYCSKPVYETIHIKGKKGFLGFGKTPDRTEKRRTDKLEFMKHNELVKYGKAENAMRLTYVARGDYDYCWKDYSGRNGQQMAVTIILPESDVKKIESIIKDNPKFIRNIVENVMKQKILNDPGEWNTPFNKGGDTLCPPYKRWDSREGGGIYVQTEDMGYGFNSEALHKFKK